MNTCAQLFLDFGAPASDGYDIWQWGLVQASKRIAELWCLPLDAVTRVKLWNIDQEFVGRLRLTQRPTRMDRTEPLKLSVGSMPFLSTEIESCSVLPKDAEVGGIATARRACLATNSKGACASPS